MTATLKWLQKDSLKSLPSKQIINVQSWEGVNSIF